MITLERFRLLIEAVRARGYGDMIAWSEAITPADDADEFASRVIYVICNSGMANTVATIIYERCITALNAGQTVTSVFRHPGKSKAIDAIWSQRETLFEAFQQSLEPIATLQSLPWIGEITALHLAKNLGADVAKPDVHMERLARRENTTTAKLCERLAADSGYRVATIDSILWRACADKILNSRAYEEQGWDAAFRPAAQPAEHSQNSSSKDPSA